GEYTQIAGGNTTVVNFGGIGSVVSFFCGQRFLAVCLLRKGKHGETRAVRIHAEVATTYIGDPCLVPVCAQKFHRQCCTGPALLTMTFLELHCLPAENTGTIPGIGTSLPPRNKVALCTRS
ncbi:unnamed protein product, partial [Ectocarpus sp. 12 AP-2014]